MNINSIKTWLSNNKVCFVTNSLATPSSLFVPSLKNYIEYIPILNFWLIPGLRNGEPFYGVQAFIFMLQYMLSNKNFDYVIYLDEDCFVTDFEALIDEFKKFKDSNCCLAGLQDGGIFCHRNHSKLMVNTFLSFWNITMLRNKHITFDNLFNYVSEQIKNHTSTMYTEFLSALKDRSDLFEYMVNEADKNISNVSRYRINHFDTPNNETPYCETVKNDENNPIEPHQTPYTYDDDRAKTNFEPYYVIEQALVLLTNTPIYYLFGTDLYDSDYVKESVKFDISGLTSAVYAREPINEFNDHKMIAVHTWFSRAYTKWPTTQLQLDHTKRINTIIKAFSRI